MGSIAFLASRRNREITIPLSAGKKHEKSPVALVLVKKLTVDLYIHNYRLLN
jgi:hypothetical protein